MRISHWVIKTFSLIIQFHYSGTSPTLGADEGPGKDEVP